jgi:WD40 repeat protein
VKANYCCSSESSAKANQIVTCEIMEMKIEDFKLSTELAGHSLDVRSVVAVNNCIVSGSRDKTARIWEMNEDG